MPPRALPRLQCGGQLQEIVRKWRLEAQPLSRLRDGSDHDAAGIVSPDGRHLAMMPHLERAILPWQWPYYPRDRRDDECTPWMQAFANAREWVLRHADGNGAV